MKKRYAFLVICLLAISVSFGQNRYQVGTLPTLNISKSLNNNWQLNFKSEFRQLFKEGITNSTQNSGYDYVHTDAAFVVSKKVGLNNKLAGGFLLRFTNKDVIKRSIQQFTIINTLSNYRLGHRFASDQTFESDQDMQLRLRYRLTFDLPLNGQTVDAQEWYFKISNEYLNIFESKDYDLELRLSPTLGYVFTDNNKLELGLEYRTNDFVNNNTRNRYWLTIGWYLSL
ncbi:hypothetical protein FHS04_000004 [Mesoflavibacter sabulilitoris]|uniref:DUF2490 domain-containing protein n=1 Tax=Mesoflavibacter zeaxanthinifaciens subsp. sabulilitoris TaxID=1520893 RepID=A0A2T1NKU8_9FLAO|nr:DUF2490 domain-containing protein [Mesoflavibacter zeaxanthinifaciens]MBB3122516.1 hypothetical protein [Mesoflavibacter zeaxanthinifaciens subsp. sabulilitoris]PSG93523.1 hypothetical protein C7H61_03150 [Mesoflavibacter zeaxanthinifaciens subsp. sabulilitoris]